MELELIKSLGPLGGFIAVLLIGHKFGWWELRRGNGNGKSAGAQTIEFWKKEIQDGTNAAVIASMKPFLDAITVLLTDNKAVQTKISEGTQELVVLARLASMQDRGRDSRSGTKTE